MQFAVGSADAELLSDGGRKEVVHVAGELIEVDARPSDAICIAVTCDPPLPIFVAEDVLEDALSAS